MPLPAKTAFTAIGTGWTIETLQTLSAETLDAVHDLIKSFDITYSRFRDDSLVAALTKQAGTYDFPASAQLLFEFYDKLYDFTKGKITPLVGSVLSDLGYDATYTLQSKQAVVPAPDWHEAVKRARTELTTNQPLVLDFGAAGKGYLADLIGLALQKYGIEEYIIDASGDIVHHAESRDTVGLEDPRNPGDVIGTVELYGQSLCASAGNRRIWQGLHHIVDPQTARPVQNVIATWVVADDGMTADGLATALFFVHASALTAFRFSYAVMFANGSLQYDKKYNWNLFTKQHALY